MDGFQYQIEFGNFSVGAGRLLSIFEEGIIMGFSDALQGEDGGRSDQGQALDCKHSGQRERGTKAVMAVDGGGEKKHFRGGRNSI